MKSNLEIIIAFLVAVMTFQSCTVYYQQNYTPEEVVQSQKKFRMVDKNGKKYPFYKLIEKDSSLYVLAKNSIFYSNKFKNREEAELGLIGFSAYSINPEDYEYFQIKNSSASGWATAGVVAISIGILYWILFDIWSDDWDDFFSFE